MKKGVAALFFVVLVAALVHETAAVDCNPTALMPCLGAITGGQNPSDECCGRLKEQQPCFCKYMNNPQFRPFIDSPNARKIAGICAIAIPTC